MKPHSWVPIAGKFDVQPDQITYRGEMVEWEGNPTEGIGMILSGAQMSSGIVVADVCLTDVTERVAADLVLYPDPERRQFVVAGIGGAQRMFAIRQSDGGTWRDLGFAGDRANLRPNENYHLRATLRGSRVTLHINDVHVLTNQLTFTP